MKLLICSLVDYGSIFPMYVCFYSYYNNWVITSLHLLENISHAEV